MLKRKFDAIDEELQTLELGDKIISRPVGEMINERFFQYDGQ